MIRDIADPLKIYIASSGFVLHNATTIFRLDISKGLYNDFELEWQLDINLQEKYINEGEQMRTELRFFIQPKLSNFTYACGVQKRIGEDASRAFIAKIEQTGKINFLYSFGAEDGTHDECKSLAYDHSKR
jgi:hypothetical protein